MTFREQWFAPASQRTLAKLAESVAHLDGQIIEVGSWEGRSTIALSRAAHPHPIFAVDTWEGSPGEISAQLASERDVFATFLDNLAEANCDNVDVCRMGWRQFFDGWNDPIKLLFIDAEHTYVEVRENIEAALPHIVSGGVICGDDVHHPPIQAAVIDALGNAKVEASLWIWRKP